MTSSTSWPCAALSSANLSSRTTLKVGGGARWLLEPANPEELAAAWVAALEVGGPVRLLGGGANLIIDDGELDGVVISTSRLRRTFRLEERAFEGDPFLRDAPKETTHEGTAPVCMSMQHTRRSGVPLDMACNAVKQGNLFLLFFVRREYVPMIFLEYLRKGSMLKAGRV